MLLEATLPEKRYKVNALSRYNSGPQGPVMYLKWALQDERYMLKVQRIYQKEFVPGNDQFSPLFFLVLPFT